MGRSRVLSFISQWGGPPSPDGRHSPSTSALLQGQKTPPMRSVDNLNDLSYQSPSYSTPIPRQRSVSRASSRPTSMIQTFQPPLMDVAQDTLPELQPIFTYLNSHSNKLYQEGYFLKLHDLDSRGRPSTDRNWQECFAQLCGTVLSVWDASELDDAGDTAEVMPTFINIADASIKMIESLPMNEAAAKSLQNVLSVSTAANNRYLFHFSSFASLTQWTAAIRLSMFEHTSLQEAYTGSLIAGKGRALNNIRQIMDKNTFKYEDWARVRFGAGTPWRRCWLVITPPDEKEVARVRKAMKKKPYGKVPLVKGDLKFYENKKVTKRSKPIATVKDAYSAYAVYPQSKPLVDQSTLVKIEGKITIHTERDTNMDGFVFVMPEIHPAISGFEMMLRFLFPIWDTFHLYGRPNKLIADTLDQRGLMFAMPRDRRYGYLELLDVSTLIHAKDNSTWSERHWRQKMRELTSNRMSIARENRNSVMSTANMSRTSLPPSRSGRGAMTPEPKRHGSRDTMRNLFFSSHKRSASESVYAQRGAEYNRRSNTTLYYSDGPPPPPPPHRENVNIFDETQANILETESNSSGKDSGDQSGDESFPPEVKQLAEKTLPPQPVSQPPPMSHAPSQKPLQRPIPTNGNRNMDNATLSQMQDISKVNRVSWSNEEDHATDMMQQHYQSRPNSSIGRYGNAAKPQQLATIPASPFVDSNGLDSGKSTNMSYFSENMSSLRPSPPIHHGSSSSISRKPVPNNLITEERIKAPTAEDVLAAYDDTPGNTPTSLLAAYQDSSAKSTPTEMNELLANYAGSPRKTPSPTKIARRELNLNNTAPEHRRSYHGDSIINDFMGPDPSYTSPDRPSTGGSHYVTPLNEMPPPSTPKFGNHSTNHHSSPLRGPPKSPSYFKAFK